eukprot:CAMPEP_0196739080 /NCGR_PEP_ID=MMETSP1091-20130531/19623_1 /TAXON_ID=302021 /ORGANISM="Rhodomonas sp., Strain CCMP768" /LENGTH=63 /DNA_ID=CAMNT_0042083343 /DNA_START=1 /DNA_END=189 /DNA_ORIENTATION=+
MSDRKAVVKNADMSGTLQHLDGKTCLIAVLIESVPPKMKLGHALTFWFPEDMQQDAIDCAAQA